ncbi:MAG: hypothetical protein MJ101_06965 [Clostridia bacterium]|nr:hypothetical protein [Clostridia bacterium]
MRSNDYTHGGSAGKNLILLLRSLINIAGFTALWFGISQLNVDKDIGTICTVAGGIITCFGLWFNLITPIIRKKR